MRFLIVCAVILSRTLYAQELQPELAPIVERYNQETAAIAKQKKAALVSPKETYLAALEAGEAKATSAGLLPAAAAVSKEREAISKEIIAAVVPKDLPKNLQSPRKVFVGAFTRICGDFAARQQKINSDYLRSLGSLQAKADVNPVLAEQIAAQKKALLRNPGGLTLAIVAAAYRGGEGRRPADVTARLQQIFDSGRPTTQCTPGEMGTDPAPGATKTLIVDYTVGGVLKQKRFSEYDTLNFREQLK